MLTKTLRLIKHDLRATGLQLKKATASILSAAPGLFIGLKALKGPAKQRGEQGKL